MGTCPGSWCHSARLAQRDLPAGQKKTTKGLSDKKFCEGGSKYSGSLNFSNFD